LLWEQPCWRAPTTASASESSGYGAWASLTSRNSPVSERGSRRPVRRRRKPPRGNHKSALHQSGQAEAEDLLRLRLLYEDKRSTPSRSSPESLAHARRDLGDAAGKHVTVEKPVSHNFFEDRNWSRLPRSIRSSSRTAWSREAIPARNAVEYLRSGAMGEIYMAKGLCFKWRDTIAIMTTNRAFRCSL